MKTLHQPMMMKQNTQTKYRGLGGALALVLLASSAPGATISMTVGNLDWNAAMWGSPAAAPTSGNDYVTAATTSPSNPNLVRLSADGSSSTFLGDNLEVIAGTRGLLKNITSTSTINGDLTISGGQVDHAANGANNSDIGGTLAVNNLIITGTGSRLGMGSLGDYFNIDGTLTGSGDLTIFSKDVHNASTISFTGISSYTGAILVDHEAAGTGRSLTVSFGGDYTFSNSFTLQDNDTLLELQSGQTLTFNEGDLIDSNGAVAAGTYSGTSLDALGVNYLNSGGTLVVVPEPSSSGLVLVVLTGALFLRRRRA